MWRLRGVLKQSEAQLRHDQPQLIAFSTSHSSILRRRPLFQGRPEPASGKMALYTLYRVRFNAH
jgi:hypothetical protein